MSGYYHTPESTIYRRISDELVVIELQSGRFFYFNPPTEKLLDFFKEARSLPEFVDGAGLTEKEPEKQHLEKFCQFLLEKGILENVGSASEFAFVGTVDYGRPELIREGERTLDEITFLCP